MEISIKMYDNSANGFCCLERKDFVKFLGILIDCNLKWKHHIENVTLHGISGIKVNAGHACHDRTR